MREEILKEYVDNIYDYNGDIMKKIYYRTVNMIDENGNSMNIQEQMIDDSGKHIKTPNGYMIIDPTVTSSIIITDEMTLDETKTAKLNEMWKACNVKILQGFYSDCTGLHGFYGFDEYDQLNMVGLLATIAIESGIDAVYWKEKGNPPQPYTAQQFTKLMSDAKKHKQDHIMRFHQLKSEVESCTTKEQVKTKKYSLT
jgi:hypothetical protein